MADRYDSDLDSNLDAETLVDGDAKFVSLDNRRTPDALEPGLVQVSQNMRLNQAVAIVRKGMSKQTNAITISNQPLIVPFTVGVSAVVVDNPNDGIFGAVLFSDPNNANLEYVIVATGSKAYLFSPGLSVVSIAYPVGEAISNTDSVDMFQAGGFVYILRGEKDVATAVTSLTSSGTTATLTTTAAHGFTTGQYVQVAGAAQPNYNGTFTITVTTSTAFTYTMPGSATSPATGTITLYRIKAPLRWDGNQADAFTALAIGTISAPKIHMPPSNFGMLQVNRAFLEYSRNSIIISDINNVESYDSIFGVFTVAPGWSDYVVGTHPYQNNQTLIFLRRSVYLLNNVDGDVVSMSNQLLTAQVGCISRRSIRTCGANVLFLSDLGVFMLQPGFELALRGNWEPLSAPIATTIQTINFSAIQSANSAYWNNRYYLAVPTGSNTRNNTLLVYNFINPGWESIDTFPTGFYADHMVVMNLNNFATLFVISREGGVYAYEQNEQDDFAAAGQAATQYPIMGVLRTRRLNFGNLLTKRFNRVVINATQDANASMQVNAITIDPSTTRTLSGTTGPAATSQINRPLLIGKRGYGLELEFTNGTNRTQITGYTVGAYISGRKNTKLV